MSATGMNRTGMTRARGWGARLCAGVLLVSAAAQAQTAATPVLGFEAVQEPLPWFDSSRSYPEYDARTHRQRPNAVPAVTAARATEAGDVKGLPPHLPPNVRREGRGGDVPQQTDTHAAESADAR